MNEIQTNSTNSSGKYAAAILLGSAIIAGAVVVTTTKKGSIDVDLPNGTARVVWEN